jgi:hypothetical protein
MIKFAFNSFMLLLCLAAVAVPMNEPAALPVSRLVNWLCLAFFAQGVWDQIKPQR